MVPRSVASERAATSIAEQTMYATAARGRRPAGRPIRQETRTALKVTRSDRLTMPTSSGSSEASSRKASAKAPVMADMEVLYASSLRPVHLYPAFWNKMHSNA